MSERPQVFPFVSSMPRLRERRLGMRWCTACGSRLSPEASRCWLCHAPAPGDRPEFHHEATAAVVPRDHVAEGPLARTTEHGDPDPVAAAAFSQARSRPTWFGVRATG